MTCSDDLDCVNDVRNGQCIIKTGRCQCNISDGYECARSDNTVMAEIAGQVVQRCRGGGRCTPSVLSNQENDYHDVVLDINVYFPVSEQEPESSNVITEALRKVLARVSATEIENVHIVSFEMFQIDGGGFVFNSNVKISVEGETHASYLYTSVSNSMSTQAVRLLSLSLSLSLSLFILGLKHLIFTRTQTQYRVKHVVWQHLIQQNSCTI